MYLPLADLRTAFSSSEEDLPRFQETLRDYLGVRRCHVAASGRAALYLLLKSLSASKPDRLRVLLPAYTCPALVRVILDAGLQPCPIDISPQTFALDGEQLRHSLDERVLAVIPVHPFGIPQDIDEGIALAHAAGAVVIEDAAQALGARWHGRPVGGRGDFGLFSFGPGKPLALAGGGAVCTDDEERAAGLDAEWRRLPRSTGMDSVEALVRLCVFRLATHPRGWWLVARTGLQRWGDSPSSWGYEVRPLSAAQARLGRALLPELDRINRVRQENALRLRDCLHDLSFVHLPSPEENAEPIYLRLPVILDTQERRERLHETLHRAGIGAGRMYRRALPELFPGLDVSSWRGAEQVARRLLTLPTHHYLTDREFDRIVRLFRAER
jgi:dTDP-4-amino-4,6-dideoxygalactose transaminase